MTIDYSTGFHTDFGANQLWSNNATLDLYGSLPAAAGQSFTPSGSAQFYMTNLVSVEALDKSLITPASGEATIGEQAVYRIRNNFV